MALLFRLDRLGLLDPVSFSRRSMATRTLADSACVRSAFSSAPLLRLPAICPAGTGELEVGIRCTVFIQLCNF